MKNIAIDVTDGQVDAYIFDPAAKRDVAGRDLALLEVSAMLHVAMDASVFRKVCSCLYASSSDVADDVESIPDLIGRNIATFILEIRRGAHLSNPSALHALMVFDFCLVQFGGLAFTSSGNLIADPRAALMLLRETARWYCAIRDGSVRPPR